MVSVRLQLTTFLTMIIIGLVIGVGFDFYRVLRSKINFIRLTTDLGDILFSLLATLLVCGGLLYSNHGRVRICLLWGLLGGLVIYYFIFSDLIINCFCYLGQVIKQVITQLSGLLTKLQKFYQLNGDDSSE